MNRSEEIEEKMKRIDELNDEKNALMVKLKRSLQIQEIWPDAFDYGSVVCSLSGNIHKDELMFSIRNGKDEVRLFKLEEVPIHLLEHQIDIQKKKVNDHFKRMFDNILKDIKKRKGG